MKSFNIEKTYPFGQLRSYLYHADINTLYLQLFSFLIKHHTLLNSKTFNNPMDQENFICEEFNAPPPDVFGWRDPWDESQVGKSTRVHLGSDYAALGNQAIEDHQELPTWV